MKVKVKLNDQGYLPDKYTKHTSANFRVDGKPAVSFPIEVDDLPTGTKTIALYMKDFDSVPVCGFVWIHWLAANIDAIHTTIPENTSLKPQFNLVQGSNSNASKFLSGETGPKIGYTGPQPPSGIHDYTLTVYALDTKLDLVEGYWLNEFLKKADKHILEKKNINLPVHS